VKLEKLLGLSRLVEQATGKKALVNAPIVGKNIFKTESGIVTGWWAKSEAHAMPLEVFPFLPELVGHDPVEILLGKKSGRDSIFYVGEKFGLAIPENAVDSILEKVKTTAEANKRALTKEEFIQIVRDAKS
jgi:isopropylmalate/homocitrate/citramalate synthase